MSNGDNFAGGFVVGALLGGVLGGVLGATLVARSGQGPDRGKKNAARKDGDIAKTDAKSEPRRRGRRWMSGNDAGEAPFSSEERIEEARHSLEAKIAQLNQAIDEARQQLSETSPLTDTLPSTQAHLGQGHAATSNDLG